MSGRIVLAAGGDVSLAGAATEQMRTAQDRLTIIRRGTDVFYTAT